MGFPKFFKQRKKLLLELALHKYAKDTNFSQDEEFTTEYAIILPSKLN